MTDPVPPTEGADQAAGRQRWWSWLAVVAVAGLAVVAAWTLFSGGEDVPPPQPFPSMIVPTQTPTQTPSPTATPTATESPSPTPTDTPTPTPTDTSSPSPTESPTTSPTPEPSPAN